MSWQLSLVACAMAPLLIGAGHCMGKEIEAMYSQQVADFARASSVAEESILAIRTVAAFGGERLAQQRFGKELPAAKRGGVRSGVKIGFAWGGLNFAYAASSASKRNKGCRAREGPWEVRNGHVSCLWCAESLIYAVTLWLGGHLMLKARAVDSEQSVVTVMIALVVGISGLSQFSGHSPTMARAISSAKNMSKARKHGKTMGKPSEMPRKTVKERRKSMVFDGF